MTEDEKKPSWEEIAALPDEERVRAMQKAVKEGRQTEPGALVVLAENHELVKRICVTLDTLRNPPPAPRPAPAPEPWAAGIWIQIVDVDDGSTLVEAAELPPGMTLGDAQALCSEHGMRAEEFHPLRFKDDAEFARWVRGEGEYA